MTDKTKAILKAINDMIFVFNVNGVIEEYISTNHKDELIQPRESFLGKHYQDVLPPHVNKKLEAAFLKLERGKERSSFDYSIELHKSTQWYTAVLSKATIEDTPKYLGAVRNITDRKLRESLLWSVLNTSPGGILVLQSVRDGDGNAIDFEITRANHSVESLTDTSLKALIG